MARKAETVESFLGRLVHGRKEDILTLRDLILTRVPSVTERIKWNAPSFCRNGDDRVTMRLHPGDRLQMVLHRGALTRPADDFSFADPAGLVEWSARDRGVVTITDSKMLAARSGDLVLLVSRWMDATA